MSSGLIVPGSSTVSLQQAAIQSAPSGRAKLDTRLLSILSANDVGTDLCDKIGEAGVKTTAVFGHLAKNEAKFEAWLKAVLGLD